MVSFLSPESCLLNIYQHITGGPIIQTQLRLVFGLLIKKLTKMRKTNLKIHSFIHESYIYLYIFWYQAKAFHWIWVHFLPEPYPYFPTYNFQFP